MNPSFFTPPNALIHMVGWSHISPGRTRLAYPPSPNALATSTPYLTGFTYFVQDCRYEQVGSCVSQEDIMGLYDRSTNIASRRDDGLWSRCCGILLSQSLFLSRESKGKKEKGNIYHDSYISEYMTCSSRRRSKKKKKKRKKQYSAALFRRSARVLFNVHTRYPCTCRALNRDEST